METKMTKSTYLFEILNDEGEAVRSFTQCCTNVGAHERVQDVLDHTPEAAAVIGAEAHGHSYHAAYRDKAA